jgi:Raf kinase inhibitor-like YbhB/YbcL family protein
MIGDLEVNLGFQEFPLEHTCMGKDISPKIILRGLKSRSIAILVFNPSVRGCLSFTPWIIWNLPAQHEIPAGIPHGKIVSSPISAVQGTNDTGKIGWVGPCPNVGEMHRYLFRVYGLDEYLNIEAGSTKYQLTAALKGHIVQYGVTEAVCSRL